MEEKIQDFKENFEIALAHVRQEGAHIGTALEEALVKLGEAAIGGYGPEQRGAARAVLCLVAA
jgi:hypothetical protein